jgi:hypothetical protein
VRLFLVILVQHIGFGNSAFVVAADFVLSFDVTLPWGLVLLQKRV